MVGERANANLPYVDPTSSETLAFRPGEGPGHADELARLGHEGEMPVEAAHRLDVSRGEGGARLVEGNVEQSIAGGVGQIDDALYVQMIHSDLRRAAATVQFTRWAALNILCEKLG